MSALSLLQALPLTSIVDAVIAITVVEAALLAASRRLAGRGPAWRDIGLNLVSGLCLMLALRAAVRDADAAWVALALLAAGTAHAADIVLRWRRAPAPGAPVHGGLA